MWGRVRAGLELVCVCVASWCGRAAAFGSAIALLADNTRRARRRISRCNYSHRVPRAHRSARRREQERDAARTRGDARHGVHRATTLQRSTVRGGRGTRGRAPAALRFSARVGTPQMNGADGFAKAISRPCSAPHAGTKVQPRRLKSSLPRPSPCVKRAAVPLRTASMIAHLRSHWPLPLRRPQAQSRSVPMRVAVQFRTSAFFQSERACKPIHTRAGRNGLEARRPAHLGGGRQDPRLLAGQGGRRRQGQGTRLLGDDRAAGAQDTAAQARWRRRRRRLLR